MNQSTADPRTALLGTHRLVEHWNRSAAGITTHQFGEAPVGYMVFDSAGWFSVHITRTPAARPFAAGPEKPTATEALQLLESYYSAFGTYDVDLPNSTIVFLCRGATRSNQVGAEARFPFRVAPRKLIIGDGTTWHRIWERMTEGSAGDA